MDNALLSLQTARRVGNLAGRIVAAVCGEIAAEFHREPNGQVHRRLAYAQRQVEALTEQVGQIMDERDDWRAAYELMTGPNVSLTGVFDVTGVSRDTIQA